MNARWLGLTHRSYYVLSLTLLTLAACQDPPSDPEPGDLSPALAATSNTWQKRIRMPSDRRLVMTATVDAPAGGSFLYAVGGRSMNSTGYCSGSLSKVQAYDGNTNTWTTKAPLPAPTYRGLTGVINRKIYVAGGCRESTRLWEYDVATNQWTAKASAPLSLPDPVGSVVAGKLYVFDECSYDACLWDSGFPGREAYTFFGFYDPALDRWVRLAPPADGGVAVRGRHVQRQALLLGFPRAGAHLHAGHRGVDHRRKPQPPGIGLDKSRGQREMVPGRSELSGRLRPGYQYLGQAGCPACGH